MPLKIIHLNHTEVMGRGLVLLSSPYYARASRDLHTGQIVEEAALLSKSWAIVAKEGKLLHGEDETSSAKSDMDKNVREFVEEYGIKCTIVISGATEPGITVRSQVDDSKSGEILDIIRNGLEPHFRVNPELDQSGNRLLVPRRNDWGADNSSAHSVQIIQIGLGPVERSFQKDKIVNSVADIVGLINAKLGFSEGASGAQD